MIFADKLIESLSDKELSNLRLNDIGVVFQSHHLLEEFSLHENIILPGSIAHNLDKDFANFLIEKLKRCCSKCRWRSSCLSCLNKI